METRKSDKKPGVVQNAADFANIFKAFIGANFLSVPFDFMQSGLVLGIIGLTIIASMTDHCCNLIIKCKNEATSRLHSIHYTPSKLHLEVEAKSDSDDDGELAESGKQLLEHFEETLTYGDLGKLCMGQIGVVLVDIGLCITQLGFCTAYVIFLGTTIASFFPYETVHSNATSGSAYTMLSPGQPQAADFSLELRADDTPNLPNLHIWSNVSNNQTNGTNSTPFPQTTENTQLTTISSFSQLPENSNGISTTDATSNSTVGENLIQESTAPSFYLLVLIPFPIFVIFAFIRNIRKLGPISMLANAALCLGFLALFLYLIMDLEKHEDVVQFRWATFPVFWGHMTAAYEGIGLVIPVESSMKGNRPNFPAFLHGAVFLLTLILGSFGIVGYLDYGSEVNQIITENLPAHSTIVYIVKGMVCFGILFTYPLQMFPVIEIFEEILFTPGRIFGPKKSKGTDSRGERSPLIKSEQKGHSSSDHHFHSLHAVAVPVPDSVPAWKRNILRTVLVVFTLIFAIIFSDSFAYITAVVGAVGSSLLAYILPCVFHLKLKWSTLNKAIIIKDLCIIVIGTTVGAISLVVTVYQMILMRRG